MAKLELKPSQLEAPAENQDTQRELGFTQQFLRLKIKPTSMVEMRASSSIMKLRSSQAVQEQVQRRTAFLLWFLIEEHEFINYILLLMNTDLRYI